MPNPTPNPVDSIDFLPAQYRKRDVQRRSQPWRLVVVVAFLALLIAAIVSQHFQTRRTRRQLAAVVPMYEAAVTQQNRLAELRSQLHTSRSSAELFTYLRHRWPRTQLLAAVVAPLPDEVTLDELTISREVVPGRAKNTFGLKAELSVTPSNSAEQQQQNEALPPAARDLKLLRDASDFDSNGNKLETVILVSGTTADSAVLHRYLGNLSRCPMFSKAEIDWIEAGDNRAATSAARGGKQKFSARIVVRPGYGQPGGPTAPPRETLAQSKPNKRMKEPSR